MEEKDENKLTIAGGAGGAGQPAGKGGNLVFNSGYDNNREPLDISNVVDKVLLGLSMTNDTHMYRSGVGATPGEIIFGIGSRDVLKIDSEGQFFLNEKPIGEDKEILLFLRGFVGHCASSMNQNPDRIAARVRELEERLSSALAAIARVEAWAKDAEATRVGDWTCVEAVRAALEGPTRK